MTWNHRFSRFYDMHFLRCWEVGYEMIHHKAKKGYLHRQPFLYFPRWEIAYYSKVHIRLYVAQRGHKCKQNFLTNQKKLIFLSEKHWIFSRHAFLAPLMRWCARFNARVRKNYLPREGGKFHALQVTNLTSFRVDNLSFYGLKCWMMKQKNDFSTMVQLGSISSINFVHIVKWDETCAQIFILYIYNINIK